MDFVGDYKKQQKLAEALRAREKRLLGMKFDTGPIVTQANEAFPGQVQANWAAPLAQLGTAYFAKQAAEKADAAELGLEEGRRNALYGILGMQTPGQAPAQPQAPTPVSDPGFSIDATPMNPMGGPALSFPGAPTPGQPAAPQAAPTAAPTGQLPEDFEMTPDKMLQLSELGIDPSLIKMMTPEREKLANLLQNIPNLTPEMGAALAPRFKLTPEEGRQMVIGFQEQQRQLRQEDEQSRIRVATAGRPPATPRQRDPIKDLQAQIILYRSQGNNAEADKLTAIYNTLKPPTGGNNPANDLKRQIIEADAQKNPDEVKRLTALLNVIEPQSGGTSDPKKLLDSQIIDARLANNEAEAKRLEAIRDQVYPGKTDKVDTIKQLTAEYNDALNRGDEQKAKELAGRIRNITDLTHVGKGGAGGGRAGKAPQMNADQVKARLDRMDEIINSDEGKIAFGRKSRASRAFLDELDVNGGPVGKAAAAYFEPAGQGAAKEFDALVADFGLEKIAQLYPASDTDVKWIMRNLASSYTNAQVAKEMIQHMRNVHEKFGVRTANDLEDGLVPEIPGITPGVASRGGGQRRSPGGVAYEVE